MSAEEIHRELCAVYEKTVMPEGTVRQWCRMFKDGQTNFHAEGRSGQSAICGDDLAQSADQKICERRHFKISELLREFPQISSTLFYNIIS
jgi:hypothetical protein